MDKEIMICAYTSIHTYYSVLKKDPTIYFAKKKKKRMKLEDVMLKNISQRNTEKKIA